MMKYALLVIAGVALVGLLLMAGCKAKTAAAPAVNSTPAATVTIAADEASCPVLGTVLKKSAMLTYAYKGKTYYFCCPPCIERFKADPQKYIDQPAKPRRSM